MVIKFDVALSGISGICMSMQSNFKCRSLLFCNLLMPVPIYLPSMIKHALVSIGELSEEAAEANNKFVREHGIVQIRRPSLKGGRGYGIWDTLGQRREEG